jgi:hypothetical protein
MLMLGATSFTNLLQKSIPPESNRQQWLVSHYRTERMPPISNQMLN